MTINGIFLPLSQSGFQISISNNYVQLHTRFLTEWFWRLNIFFRDNFLSLNFIENQEIVVNYCLKLAQAFGT